MTAISQLTPYTCIPACFESYFIDIGIPIDQCKLLKDYRQFCFDPKNIEHFGIMSELQMRHFANSLKIETTPYDFIDQTAFTSLARTLTREETIFVMTLWKRSTYHCVRFHRILNENAGEYEFMCPRFNGPGIFESENFLGLIEGGFRTLHLKKLPAQ